MLFEVRIFIFGLLRVGFADLALDDIEEDECDNEDYVVHPDSPWDLFRVAIFQVLDHLALRRVVAEEVGHGAHE